MQAGLERYLLLRPCARELSKISSILMEGKQLRVLVVTFWSGSSTSDFYKIIKVPIAILRWIQFKAIIYLDDMLQISQTINGLDIARDILIFLLQSLGFVINL